MIINFNTDSLTKFVKQHIRKILPLSLISFSWYLSHFVHTTNGSMDSFTDVINFILSLICTVGGLILAGIEISELYV